MCPGNGTSQCEKENGANQYALGMGLFNVPMEWD